ncbi:MAG: hypothetical protein LH702_02850 [Phormidesmis sp. CAN_BIN44]|nr:hypothetical protein [Phormidesmis sp. CAN_BIN44]
MVGIEIGAAESRDAQYWVDAGRDRLDGRSITGEQLRCAGEALLQVAELCEMHAQLLITEWEETYRDPIVEQGFFADVVRQTMTVDLSDLMEPAPSRHPQVKSTSKPTGSIATPVEKSAVLELVEHLEAEAETQNQQVLGSSHDENVSHWIAMIVQSFQNTPAVPLSFAELCQRTELAGIEVLLGVLLGGFELEQRGQFYQSAIWVKRPSERSDVPGY